MSNDLLDGFGPHLCNCGPPQQENKNRELNSQQQQVSEIQEDENTEDLIIVREFSCYVCWARFCVCDID